MLWPLCPHEMSLNPSKHWTGEWVGKGQCWHFYSFIYIYIKRTQNWNKIETYKTLVPHRHYCTRSLARYIDLNHFFFFQKTYASINFSCTSSILQQKKHTTISQTQHYFMHSHTHYLSINVLWFLLDPNTAVQLIFLRGKFQLSLRVHEVISQSHLAL